MNCGVNTMFFARVGAAIFVILLISGFAFVGVAGAAVLGPMSAHGTNVDHVGGKVIQIGPGRDFVFKTNAGIQVDFICGLNCRASLRHLQRHLKEGAPTDVYFVQGPGKLLQVIDVD